jgi:hypothetical protein
MSRAKRKPAGRADFARQVATVKGKAADSGMLAELVDGAIADPKTPARVRAWLKQIQKGDRAKGEVDREK